MAKRPKNKHTGGADALGVASLRFVEFLRKKSKSHRWREKRIEAPIVKQRSDFNEDTILRGIMGRMHAEAVKRGGIPSKLGLIHDISRAMTCTECDASYYLHYDREAGMRSTLCSILAAEIITARHPDHEQSIVLELPEQVTDKLSKKEIAWSIRLDLGNLRKKRPDVI